MKIFLRSQKIEKGKKKRSDCYYYEDPGLTEYVRFLIIPQHRHIQILDIVDRWF